MPLPDHRGFFDKPFVSLLLGWSCKSGAYQTSAGGVKAGRDGSIQPRNKTYRQSKLLRGVPLAGVVGDKYVRRGIEGCGDVKHIQ